MSRTPDGESRTAVVLAAGKGTRMRSALPKVLQPAAGRPLLAWVVEAARAAGCDPVLVVVGHGAERVREEFAESGLRWVLQEEQRGTGHALAQAAAHLATAGTLPTRPISPTPSAPGGGAARASEMLLVLSGDVPLVRPETLARLLAAAGSSWGAMAVAELAEPGDLGRVLARPAHPSPSGEAGEAPAGGEAWLDRIVEAADAAPEELAVTTVNAGIYALPAPEIFDFLSRQSSDNAKGEIYLTGALNSAAAAGRPVRLVRLQDPLEALGVNTRAELARAHRLLIDRHLAVLMDSGVTVLEPARTVVEPTVCVGADTVIHPGACLLGRTSVGPRCVLHQGAWLRDTRLAEGVAIEPYSVLDGAEVEPDCRVGPFARLRPASHLLRGARVGNFVEVKNSRLGERSRAGHLAYLGDASVGAGANIGAGTVTCNFDGAAKHPTEIGPGAFVGSGTLLVAPVKVGEGAVTAAGSVITRDVPERELAVARVRQRNLPQRRVGALARRPDRDNRRDE